MPANPGPGPPPRPKDTPGDVRIEWEARRPTTDPTLGIEVSPPLPRDRAPLNQLVTVGDSLTHGFQSLAISKTGLSWPAQVARALGLSASAFRFPTYEGYGGLPFNLEWAVRGLQTKFPALDLQGSPTAFLWLLCFAHKVKHWWAHEADRYWVPPPGLNHNLAVYSYDVYDAYSRTLRVIEASIAQPSGLVDKLFDPLTPHDVDRAARRVFANANPDSTLVGIAKEHSDQGGVETLVVALGANNALGAVIDLKYVWACSEADRAQGRIWSPSFFKSDWDGLVARVREVAAEHVIVATVPHVTIAPILAAVGGPDSRLRPDSRYFHWYTHFWLRDKFRPGIDPALSGDQARAIDSAIDQYNETIINSVAAARHDGLDWQVFDICGLLDRLAWRRYLQSDAAPARPTWWEEVGGAYPLPEALQDLPVRWGSDKTLPADTRFFEADKAGRTAGGLIGLDGVHPTTVGYGILAQAVLNIVKTFPDVAHVSDIDFASLVRQDTLVTDPPTTLTGDLHIVGWVNKRIDIVSALLHGK